MYRSVENKFLEVYFSFFFVALSSTKYRLLCTLHAVTWQFADLVGSLLREEASDEEMAPLFIYPKHPLRNLRSVISDSTRCFLNDKVDESLLTTGSVAF